MQHRRLRRHTNLSHWDWRETSATKLTKCPSSTWHFRTAPRSCTFPARARGRSSGLSIFRPPPRPATRDAAKNKRKHTQSKQAKRLRSLGKVAGFLCAKCLGRREVASQRDDLLRGERLWEIDFVHTKWLPTPDRIAFTPLGLRARRLQLSLYRAITPFFPRPVTLLHRPTPVDTLLCKYAVILNTCAPIGFKYLRRRCLVSVAFSVSDISHLPSA